jgi:beta-xylosidase
MTRSLHRHVGKAALVTIACTAGMVALIGALAGRVYAGPGTFNAPVYSADFPDPSIILVNGTYWAYSTGSSGRNLQVMSSTDLQSWSSVRDPLPVLPGWATTGRTWAPGVVQVGSTFLMYYTVHDAALNQQCISLAQSASPAGPAGPFVDQSTGPLICQSPNGGSIDPNPFVDSVTGKLYLLWKSDDNSLGPGHPTHLWGQPLSSDGTQLAPGTSPSLLLTESAAWQSPAIEGPTMVRSGGRYYLFYGANNYDSASSGIGYAVSSSPLGGFANRSWYGPWLGTRGNAQGPQGPSVFTDSSGTRMAFAAWYGTAGYENGGVRSLWIGTLGFSRFGSPTLS